MSPSSPLPDGENARREAFLDLFLPEVESGHGRPLVDWLRLFPDIPEFVARQVLFEEMRADEEVAEEAAAPEASAAERLGPYRLEALLDQGGQGAVYAAVDTRYPRRVALKRLRSGVILTPREEARLEREAKILARLDHPGICRLFEAGIVDDEAFIAMELIPGESLKEKLRRERFEGETPLDRPVPPDPKGGSSVGAASTPTHPTSRRELDALLRLFEELAEALEYAHRRGVIHRDLKPGNVMITPEGQGKLVDFGLARHDEAGGPSMTTGGPPIGTWNYMSPEQTRGVSRSLDGRTDIWSLAVTLFECLTGRPPFRGATEEDIVHAIRAARLPDARERNRQVPADLQVVLEKALEKDPAHRYARAADLAEDLRRIRTRHPIRARRSGAVVKGWRWTQRNPVTASLLTGLFVVLTVFSLFTAATNRDLSRLNASLAEKTEDAQEQARARSAALERERAARHAEARALEERTRTLTEYERLADLQRLEKAQEEADALWPARPEILPALRAWQDRYEELFARLPDHRAALLLLEERALPYDEATRRRDHAAAFEELAELDRHLAAIDASPLSEDQRRLARARALRRRAKLEMAVARRGSARFEDPTLQFRHDGLLRLVRGLEEAVENPEKSLVRSVARRMTRAREIARRSRESAFAEGRWEAARARIARHPLYRLDEEERARLGARNVLPALYDPKTGAMRLPPQTGLLPLGPDPVTGLEEFLHLETHGRAFQDPRVCLPQRRRVSTGDPRGGWHMEPHTGLILVLLPAGTVMMGTQDEDPAGPNFDPRHMVEEGSPHDVPLGAFFLSKYEMTQGQWARAASWVGGHPPDPSFYGPQLWSLPEGFLPRVIDRAHPVENMNWLTADDLVQRIGLVLPTEARWEYAARAGPAGAYWSGTSDRDALPLYANLSGEEAIDPNPDIYDLSEPGHFDRFQIAAPVGTFRPNAFGFFDMTGNVWEWCRDPFSFGFTSPPRPRDGLRRLEDPSRCYRGGSHRSTAAWARIGNRNRFDPKSVDLDLGLRPAREIELD